MATTTPDLSRSRPGASGLRTGLTRLATETKHALKTTEFYAYVVTFVLILIAGNSIEGKDGGTDYFAGDKVWLYVTLLTIGYMISRGLAKSGSREPYYRDGTNADADRDGR